MSNLDDECDLFRALRKTITTDMVANGVPPSDACGILNWFDPSNPAYLTRVSDWQTLLCKGCLSGTQLFPEALIHLGVVRRPSKTTYSILGSDAYLVKQVHQIAKMLYKFKGDPRKETDMEEVKHRFSRPTSYIDSESVSAIASKLSCLAAPYSWESLRGRFGPGATAEGLHEVGKWGRYGCFPAAVPITLYISSLCDYCELPLIKRCRYGITKIAEVPKSLKSNRVVSSEMANFMFAQLAVADHLSRELHKKFPENVFLHDATAHNRLLANSEFCSIDLSDASDHVSRRLVWYALPSWREYLFSVRSTFARFPDGSLVPLRTFAPMGSGVCFPVLTAMCLGVCSVCCSRPFHVYGDDLIVHAHDYVSVCDMLERIGLVINSLKSCNNRTYRESCGLEMFGSTDITPCYLRSHPRQMPGATIEVIARKLQAINWNTVLDRIFVLHEYVPLARYNLALQRVEVKVREEIPITPKTHLYGTNGLTRWFSINAESSEVYKGSVITKTAGRFRPGSIYPYLSSRSCNPDYLPSFYYKNKGRK